MRDLEQICEQLRDELTPYGQYIVCRDLPDGVQPFGLSDLLPAALMALGWAAKEFIGEVIKKKADKIADSKAPDSKVNEKIQQLEGLVHNLALQVVSLTDQLERGTVILGLTPMGEKASTTVSVNTSTHSTGSGAPTTGLRLNQAAVTQQDLFDLIALCRQIGFDQDVLAGIEIDSKSLISLLMHMGLTERRAAHCAERLLPIFNIHLKDVLASKPK